MERWVWLLLLLEISYDLYLFVGVFGQKENWCQFRQSLCHESIEEGVYSSQFIQSKQCNSANWMELAVHKQ